MADVRVKKPDGSWVSLTGPAGPPGANSTVPGPQGPQGIQGDPGRSVAVFEQASDPGVAAQTGDVWIVP